MIMDSAKNVRWIIPFKKFGMIRVKEVMVMVVLVVLVVYPPDHVCDTRAQLGTAPFLGKLSTVYQYQMSLL